MAAKTLPGGTFAMAEDLNVTRMGYDAMQLAGPGIFGPPKDRDAANAVLREAVTLGITRRLALGRRDRARVQAPAGAPRLRLSVKPARRAPNITQPDHTARRCPKTRARRPRQARNDPR